MSEQIPVNLKYTNPKTEINDHLLPTTRADLVEETEVRQFVSARDKERFNAKQDALGYDPLNRSGDTMNGPLILSSDRIMDNRQAVTKEYVDELVADLVHGSPEALDTLYELAAAIDNDPNFAISVTSVTGKKLDKTEADILPHPNKLLYLNANGELDTNAASASKLKNAFTFRLTGDISMDSIEIDGTANIVGNTSIDTISDEDIEAIFDET